MNILVDQVDHSQSMVLGLVDIFQLFGVLVEGFVDVVDVVVLLELLVHLWYLLGFLDQRQEHVGVLLGDLESAEVGFVNGGVFDDFCEEAGDGADLVFLFVEGSLVLGE